MKKSGPSTVLNISPVDSRSENAGESLELIQVQNQENHQINTFNVPTNVNSKRSDKRTGKKCCFKSRYVEFKLNRENKFKSILKILSIHLIHHITVIGMVAYFFLFFINLHLPTVVNFIADENFEYMNIVKIVNYALISLCILIYIIITNRILFQSCKSTGNIRINAILLSIYEIMLAIYIAFAISFTCIFYRHSIVQWFNSFSKLFENNKMTG